MHLNSGHVMRKPVTAICIHVIDFKRASGRFSFHFREVFKKCTEYIGKLLIQMREISKFW